MPESLTLQPTSAQAGLAEADPPEDREESRWIARARQGDGSAVDWLVERYRRRVVRLAAHTLRRPDEADDVAQEAFVRAFRSLHAFRGDARFHTWLYRIVVRICLDRKRAARWGEVALDTTPEPWRAGMTEQAHTRILVEALLDRLPPEQRAMLVLRDVEGLAYEEIAEALGTSTNRVRWCLQSARERFRKMWERSARETDDV